MSWFPKYIGMIFFILSMESLLHISVDLAPVKPYKPHEIVTSIMDVDKEQLELENDIIHNYTDSDTTNISMTKEEPYIESNKYLKEHAMNKKGINWDEVIPNRPLLAKVMSLGCLSFLFAVTSGVALWLTIYTHLKHGETKELDSLAEKLIPLKLRCGLKKQKPKEAIPVCRERDREYKSLLHAVLKTERKTRRRKKGRRSNPGLDLTRGEMLAQKKRGAFSAFNTKNMKALNLNKQNIQLRTMLGNGKRGREKMQHAEKEKLFPLGLRD